MFEVAVAQETEEALKTKSKAQMQLKWKFGTLNM